jgi:hypothetical protein
MVISVVEEKVLFYLVRKDFINLDQIYPHSRAPVQKDERCVLYRE